jgi:hypothetical protein
MSAIQFVARDAVGNYQQGTVFNSQFDGTLYLTSGSAVSLNMRRLDVTGYLRQGDDLVLMLADGRKILLENYFGPDGNPQADIYLNEGGYLIATHVSATGEVNHSEAQIWGKWGDLSALTFPDDPVVVANAAYSDDADAAVARVMAENDLQTGVMDQSEDNPTMLAGFGLAPLAGIGSAGTGMVLGASALGGALLLTGGSSASSASSGSGNGTGGTNWGSGSTIVPAIDRADDDYVFNGRSEMSVTITGIAEPDSRVDVVIGGKSVVTHSVGQGRWSAEFTGTNFPGDGEYKVTVTVTEPSGKRTQLEGQDIVVDTTPPDIDVTGYGNVSGQVVNAIEHRDGFSLVGTGEAGARVTLEVNGFTRTTTISQNGTWSIEFAHGDLPTGEYDVNVRVTATDDFENAQTVTHTITIDTLAPDVGFHAVQAGDNTINRIEANAGIDLTGVAEPDSAIEVTMGGHSYTTTTNASGHWTVTVPSGDITRGEYTAAINVTATDAAGNVNSASSTLQVDTLGTVTIDPGRGAAGESVFNSGNEASTLHLTGTTEPGSSVTVEIQGASYVASVGASGAWSVVVPGTGVTSGEYTTRMTVTATDAAGNRTTTTGTLLVDTENSVSVMNGFGGADGVISGSEASGGVTFNGTGEPGASVSVMFQGRTHDATVSPSGVWSATFTGSEVPTGVYQAPLTVVSTDLAGNTATATKLVSVDTATSVSATIIGAGADSVVNAVEAAAGLTLTGLAEPGATVTVDLGGSTRSATVQSNGSWSVVYPNGSIPGGDYPASVTVTSTDAYGNTATTSTTLAVDTVVTDFTSSGVIDADGTVNDIEASDGITLTGTVEPGSGITVKIGTATRTASVDASGNWSVDFPASETPRGEQSAAVVVTATDAAGNTSVLTDTVVVDTEVNRLALAGPIAGDGAINAAEAAHGITLTGAVEAGSTVMVNLAGTSRPATVDASGNWTVGFAGSEIGTGERDLAVTITATDAAGNTRVETDTVALDTEAPEAAFVTAFNRSGAALRGFSVDAGDATAELSTVGLDGNQGTIGNVQFNNPVAPGEVDFYFTQPLPNGSHLVITKTDGAGNESATLFALDQGLPDAIDLKNPGLSQHEIEAVDLRFAEDSTLTIDSNLLEGLSGNSNALTVHGSADDAVAIDRTNGATFTDTNQNVTIGSELYSIYTLGDEGGTLIIDDDITITT